MIQPPMVGSVWVRRATGVVARITQVDKHLDDVHWQEIAGTRTGVCSLIGFAHTFEAVHENDAR